MCSKMIFLDFYMTLLISLEYLISIIRPFGDFL